MNWIKHPIRDRVAAAHDAYSGAPPARLLPSRPGRTRRCFNERGIPSITYGPGSKYCYWDEEYVPIAEYLQAIKVYAATPRSQDWFRSG